MGDLVSRRTGVRTDRVSEDRGDGEGEMGRGQFRTRSPREPGRRSKRRHGAAGEVVTVTVCSAGHPCKTCSVVPRVLRSDSPGSPGLLN